MVNKQLHPTVYGVLLKLKRVGRDSFENRKNDPNLLSHQENLIL